MQKLETTPEKAIPVEQYGDMKMIIDREAGTVVYDLTDDNEFFDFIFKELN
jgi:hypothetical protein